MVEQHRDGFFPILGAILVASLGLFSAGSCVTAEFNRAKLKDLKSDGKLCYLPGSRAFGLGIAALACWSVAQIIGNLMACKNRKSNTKTRLIPSFLLATSWASFGVGLVLLGSATSMSRRQDYGQGWLDGECYLVKDGIFIGSAVLALASVASTLMYATTFKSRPVQVDQESTVRQQLDPK